MYVFLYMNEWRYKYISKAVNFETKAVDPVSVTFISQEAQLLFFTYQVYIIGFIKKGKAEGIDNSVAEFVTKLGVKMGV